MSKTHLLTVWFAANQFPITMPLDQSAVNYTAQKGEARFRRLQSADHVSVHCKYSIIVIGLLKTENVKKKKKAPS